MITVTVRRGGYRGWLTGLDSRRRQLVSTTTKLALVVLGHLCGSRYGRCPLLRTMRVLQRLRSSSCVSAQLPASPRAVQGPSACPAGRRHRPPVWSEPAGGGVTAWKEVEAGKERWLTDEVALVRRPPTTHGWLRLDHVLHLVGRSAEMFRTSAADF